MTHTFLDRSVLVPVAITCVVRENKERDNKTTSVRVFTSNTSYDELLKKAKIYPIHWKTSQNSYGSFQELICFYVFLISKRTIRSL